MAPKDSRGLWLALSAVELADSPKIAKMLKPFHEPIQDCYECGVEVPTLSCKRKKGLNIAVTGLFLKRVLNDLRAVWNLLLLGYTSQAGSVAAAAFENALIVSCVAGNIQRAEKLSSSAGSSPWKVANLCKMFTHQLNERKLAGKTSSALEDDSYWKVLYSQYKWLCKVKHPTISSATHDAFSVSLDGDEYIIMAAPDTRIEDLPSKAFILSVTILRVTEAIESFALAREIDYKDDRAVSWQERFDKISKDLDKAVDPLIKKTRLPFDYNGRVFRKQ
jgi:hypothetical protein